MVICGLKNLLGNDPVGEGVALGAEVDRYFGYGELQLAEACVIAF